MYLVLFGIGLLFAAAGFVTIGFGIPINAFSLGNTLIIAGTVAVVGGMILVGIAVAIRHLNRIVDAIGRAGVRAAPAMDAAETLAPPAARIQPPRVAAPAKQAEPPVPPAPKHAEPAPKPPEFTMPRPAEPRPAAVEPRFPATSEASSGPLDWLRSKTKPGAEVPPVAAEPTVVEVPDEAPLSPRAPHRPVFVPPAVEPHVEPKAWTPELPREARMEMPPRVETPPRAVPASERPKDVNHEAAKPAKDSGLFDVVWPDARSKPMPAPAPEPRREPKVVEAPRPPAPMPERSAAILKSGVIDGMAYTLYVDGSIEAELPQGTVKFASVDALRAHLEKSA